MRLMQKAIGEGWQLRVVGSAISPNGLAFASKCMISMAQMDQVLDIDKEKKQARGLQCPAVSKPSVPACAATAQIETQLAVQTRMLTQRVSRTCSHVDVVLMHAVTRRAGAGASGRQGAGRR